MDTITQACLGASVGQGFFARRLGRKANWWGALGGLFPDFDVFLGPFVGQWGELIWHRGPTHALWFGPLAGPLLGWLTWRYYRRKARRRAHPRTQQPPDLGVGAQTADQKPPDPASDAALPAWMGLWTLALFTHPLLDVFTTYGTQLLAPFSDMRFALDGVSIIDPFYTLVLGIALVIGWRSRRLPARAMRAAQVALLVTTAYLGYGVMQNARAVELVAAQVADREVEAGRIDAYPTFFQPWFRRVTVWYPDAVEVGFISTLRPRPIEWTRVPLTTGAAVDTVLVHEHARLFRWFANDRLVAFTTPLPDGVRVELEDFRLAYPTVPGRALWGIRAEVGADGEIRTPPSRFRNPPPPDMKGALNSIWKGVFPP